MGYPDGSGGPEDGAADFSSLPGAGLLVGLAVSVFQATTSIQEQTLAFIPKIVAVFVAILIFGPWMLRLMVEYVTNVLVNLPYYIG